MIKTKFSIPFGFVVFLSSVVIFFRRISTFPLRNWDEAWYAEIVKNMALGNYSPIVPFWNGRYYFDHAPLYFWLSAPVFKIFGGGEWQARLVSAVSAVLAVIFVYLIGKKLAGAGVGILSALIFVTIGGVTIRFAHGNLDSLLVLLFLASFYFYLESAHRSAYSFLAGLMLGLGLIVKSWGVGIFPLVLIFIYSYINGKRLPKNYPILIGAPAIFFLFWSVIGYINFGQTFINWYWFNPSENRLGDPVGNFSLDYFKFALRDVGLWLVVPVLFFTNGFKKIFKDTKPFIVSSAFVSFVYVFFLNFLSDKSDWYLIPTYPLLSIIMAIFMVKLLREQLRLMMILFSLLIAVQYFNVLRIENIYPDRSRVGAELGLEARRLIPFEDEIILVDPDFTSFLYYSDQNHIYTLQESRKPNEWWILTRAELDSFLRDNPKTWIVKKKESKISSIDNVGQAISEVNNYEFIRLY